MFFIKKWLYQSQFFEDFGGEIIPSKKSMMASYHGGNLQYLQE